MAKGLPVCRQLVLFSFMYLIAFIFYAVKITIYSWLKAKLYSWVLNLFTDRGSAGGVQVYQCVWGSQEHFHGTIAVPVWLSCELISMMSLCVPKFDAAVLSVASSLSPSPSASAGMHFKRATIYSASKIYLFLGNGIMLVHVTSYMVLLLQPPAASLFLALYCSCLFSSTSL